MSLRRLGVDRIDLFQLHRIDPKVPLEDQIGLLAELQDEGKIGAIGLSEVSTEEIDQVRKITDVATVQNLYNLTNRKSEPVLRYAEQHGIGFIPWFPIAAGRLAEPGGPVDELVKKHDATPAQVALAWLLGRAQIMLPIPGTSTVAHLEENVAAADLYARLSHAEIAELTEAVDGGDGDEAADA
jgi:pyridoxine 4-dehydrogenase